MSGIICAIRGGPDSRPTIQKSILLAKETGQKLYFLYVVNLDFLAHTTSSRVAAISTEMHQMGEFILLSAQQTAARQDVPAEIVVRQGSVSDEIIALCHEVEANYVILGVPQQAVDRENAFDRERINQFSQRLESESGAKVYLVEGDEL
ncbi:MAG: universal stress protein [Anaerolineales bacterium]|jgi:nucleotide-binding universal stress UspA family protein